MEDGPLCPIPGAEQPRRKQHGRRAEGRLDVTVVPSPEPLDLPSLARTLARLILDGGYTPRPDPPEQPAAKP
ncbi:MAG: hypothetical protein M3409_03780 [Gemmatimonadota bacterium]|nr:hypothetical protein [Gemmatimonadota bacterium]